jgi:aerobic carbon-monoxide dehydrogenase medium subunit
MYPFAYHKPATRDEALATARGHEDAKFLAGGMTLLPTMKQRLAAPPHLVDLNGLNDMRGIVVDAKTVVVGAMTRHVTVATSPDVAAAIPALAALAGMIGDPAVRNRGTIGGSVANNDPAADYPAACLALGATIQTDKRVFSAEDFFVGLFETALEEGEMIVKISFPIPAKAAYEKFRNPASRYAIVGVFVAQTANGARVVVTGAGSNGVFRAKHFEQALDKDFSAKALQDLTVDPAGLNTDIHADAEYRAHLIGVMARRAVAQTE